MISHISNKKSDSHANSPHCRLYCNSAVTAPFIIIAKRWHDFLFCRHVLLFCLVNKIDSIDKVEIIFIKQCRIFCKLNEVGCLEQLP